MKRIIYPKEIWTFTEKNVKPDGKTESKSTEKKMGDWLVFICDLVPYFKRNLESTKNYFVLSDKLKLEENSDLVDLTDDQYKDLETVLTQMGEDIQGRNIFGQPEGEKMTRWELNKISPLSGIFSTYVRAFNQAFDPEEREIEEKKKAEAAGKTE